MSIFITLIAALIVFSAVIAIHEFGHFTVAKLCGIHPSANWASTRLVSIL